MDTRQDIPVCLHVAQIAGAFDVDRLATLRDSQDIMLVFLDKDKKGAADSDYSGMIIERMKQEAVNTIRALNASGQVEKITGQIKYQPVVKDFNKCLTGVAIQLTLKPFDSVCV